MIDKISINKTEKFIEKFQDRVDWDWIFKHQILFEKFIEKFHLWFFLSLYP